jgi:hypothetical protein
VNVLFSAGAADGLGVGQGQRPGVAGGVTLDADQHRRAAALGELAAHQVTGGLGRDHAHVHARGRRDEVVPDVEAVGEEQRVALDQGRRDRLGVQLPLQVVRDQDHDQVGFLARLGGRDDPQAVVGRLLPALGALGQPDPDVHAGVTERERVRVALAAIPENGHVPSLDDGQVGAVVVEDLCH